MSMEDLSSVLWRERELLETLLFKLEVEQLVLATGRSRWLPAAAREIEEVLDAIRETELLRGLTADAVAAELGLDPNPSLREIAEACDEPWRTIWLDHRETFTSVSAEITAMAENNRELLTSGYQAAKATLLSLSEPVSTYSQDGSVVTERRTSLLDRSI
ncbi:MAG TPA: flagellar protein FlgN [Nocardioidaceae bacterium]|nr:flagellar protein FlgN [Nocardioidaceae bacterium]